MVATAVMAMHSISPGITAAMASGAAARRSRQPAAVMPLAAVLGCCRSCIAAGCGPCRRRALGLLYKTRTAAAVQPKIPPAGKRYSVAPAREYERPAGTPHYGELYP